MLADRAPGDPLFAVARHARSSEHLYLSLRAVPLSRKSGDFVELPQCVETTALLAITDDLEAVALQLRNGVEISGGCGVEVDHR